MLCYDLVAHSAASAGRESFAMSNNRLLAILGGIVAVLDHRGSRRFGLCSGVARRFLNRSAKRRGAARQQKGRGRGEAVAPAR